MNWQLNKIQYPVYNLGAGKRIGIWTQGCNLGCKGCVNQMLWSAKGGKSIAVVDVLNWLLPIAQSYDGLTISGGEPFQQYKQMITFLHLVKMKTKLSVHCYSGYYLDELEQLFPDGLYKKYIDTLVDGRYIQKQHEDINVRGSSNQTVYRFVDGVAVKETQIQQPKKWSVKVDEDGEIYMAGIPKKNELKELCVHLAEVGIQKEFR